MISVIKELNDNGDITERAVYMGDPKEALVNYIEMYIKGNCNTWTYKDSNVHNEVQLLNIQLGYMYSVPGTNTVITSTIRQKQ